FCIWVSHTEKRLVPAAMLMPMGHFCPPWRKVIRFLSTGLAMGLGVPPGVSTRAMNWSLKAVHTYSGYSAEKKKGLKENAVVLVGARRVSTSITESLAVLGFVTLPVVQVGAEGRPPAVLSGGFGVLNQSLMQVALVQAPMSTALAGVCEVLTLKPPGAPPLG